MSSDPTITPPPPGTETLETVVVERPHVQFSFVRWSLTGVVRVFYRFWTRIAAHLFPENSRAEKIAHTLHIPLPDQLNMNWVTDHLAVGGRVHLADIKALARTGITHVVDTRSEYSDDVQALAKVRIELLRLPAADTQPFTIEQMIQGAKWIHERIAQDGRILIH